MGKSGSSTLKNRVLRHLRLPEKKRKHWHIDYLLDNKNMKIIKIFLIPCEIKLECSCAKELINYCGSFIKGFGCSDCKCKSHLAYSEGLLKMCEFHK